MWEVGKELDKLVHQRLAAGAKLQESGKDNVSPN